MGGMKVSNMDFIKLLPAFMQDDEAAIALSKAVNKLIGEPGKRLATIRTWDKVDELTEAECNEMAWELDIDWYDSEGMSLTEKRNTIKLAQQIKRKRGTKWAVERLIGAYFGEGYVMEWFEMDDSLPYGNNNYGKDSRESNYKAVPSYYESGKIARVATGTGPISWSHDKTMAGIWDLNGNVWEWQGGIRLVWGELQILANNDAADPDNPQNATSTCWKAINAADGALVDPESKTTDSSAHVSGKTVKLDYVNNKWTYSTSITNAKDESRSCAFYQVAADSSIGDAAKVMLRALALLPDSDVTTDVYEGDYMWWNNGVAERCVCRGGGWGSGANAGVFYLYGGNSRSGVSAAVGFRAAYIPEIR